LTNAAKQLIKVARQEVSEIEACPDCYAHSRNLPRPQPSWFIEPCRRPHPLVWAKLKGFPFWPAKAMPRVNSQGHVDVRFFGEHDRAWVPPKDLYLYSEEPPAPSPRKRKTDMDECVREITRHCRKLALMFGQFKFAPPKVQYDPNDPKQIQLMLPNYNPLEPNSHFPILEPSSASVKKKNLLKKRSSSVKGGKLQSDEAPDNEVDASSKENKNNKQEKSSSEATAPKVQKLDVDDTKNTSNSHLDTKDSKLGNAKTQEAAAVAQNKTVKNEKPKSATASTRNVPSVDNVENNTTRSGSSDKNNASKLKEETKSPAAESSSATPPRETSEMTRMRKRSLLKNIINPQLALSRTEKTSTKHVKNNKVYKPKTRMVDKLNAEKALKSVSASKENEKLSSSPNSSGVIHKMSNNNKESPKGAQKIPEIDISISPPTIPASSPKVIPVSTSTPLSTMPDKSVLLLVVNNSGKNETKQIATTGGKDVNSVQKDTHLQKRDSKARKTLHNKPRNPQIVQQHLLPSAGESILISPTKRETSSYQLPPPEAGPISARLHHDANELARRMGQLMEDAYKEAAQANINGENGTAENYESTVFFLQMQIEHMKWRHQQQLAELKHNSGTSVFIIFISGFSLSP